MATMPWCDGTSMALILQLSLTATMPVQMSLEVPHNIHFL